MIERLSDCPSSEDVRDFVFTVNRILDRYNWWDEVIHPWAGVPMKLSEIVEQVKSKSNWNEYNREYLIDLANGMARILDAWVEQEKTGVWIQIKKTGKMSKLPRDFAEELVESGVCEWVVGGNNEEDL